MTKGDGGNDFMMGELALLEGEVNSRLLRFRRVYRPESTSGFNPTRLQPGAWAWKAPSMKLPSTACGTNFRHAIEPAGILNTLYRHTAAWNVRRLTHALCRICVDPGSNASTLCGHVNAPFTVPTWYPRQPSVHRGRSRIGRSRRNAKRCGVTPNTSKGGGAAATTMSFHGKPTHDGPRQKSTACLDPRVPCH
jgi:hypothetical protein